LCYKLTVKTPGGNQYESSFEELMPCPKVDSVYYERKMIETTTIGDNEDGLQFYIDFRGDDTDGRFFRWILEETYEYHSTWSIMAYLNEKSEYVFTPEDVTNYVCYKTNLIGDIFTLSTNGLVQNSYKKYPLHFVIIILFPLSKILFLKGRIIFGKVCAKQTKKRTSCMGNNRHLSRAIFIT